jgi:hypothetical protein
MRSVFYELTHQEGRFIDAPEPLERSEADVGSVLTAGSSITRQTSFADERLRCKQCGEAYHAGAPTT